MRDIWQSPFWPKLTFDADAVAPILAAATESIGVISGMLAGLPPAERVEIRRHHLMQEAVSSFGMNGITLDTAQARQEVATVLLEARQGRLPLTADRLQDWHRRLFSEEDIADRRMWRRHDIDILYRTGPGDERFRAPPATQLNTEMAALLGWLNHPPQMPAILRAALAHLWFDTIQPFSDGNGQMARMLIDHILATGRGLPFSLSRQIAQEKAAYYGALQAGRREGQGAVDATDFVVWFLGCVRRAAEHAGAELGFLLRRSHYLTEWRDRLSRRQIAVLEALFAEGAGAVAEGLTAAHFARIAKVSGATATRDLGAMTAAGALLRSEEGGRSTRYWLRFS